MSVVLIVDDDPLFRKATKHHLELMGFSVVESVSGAEVVALIHQHRPKVCLIDVFMDKKDGIETLREIRELQEPTICIAVSIDAKYLEVMTELGAEDALLKPVSPHALSVTFQKFSIT